VWAVVLEDEPSELCKCFAICLCAQVQFMIGTPPGGGQRRRSASGSSCETPPPVTTWQVSPVSGGKLTPTSSPLRRSGTVSTIIFTVNLIQTHNGELRLFVVLVELL